MTFNPHTATNEELRDWLARDMGWTFRSACGNHWWEQSEGDPGTENHPIPNTLDAAAAAMPEGWDWWKSSSEYLAQAAGTDFVRVRSTGDEITDRFRLAVLCHMAGKKGTP